MEIKIDTNKDSKEDMKKVIKLLQEIVGDTSSQSEGYTNIFEGTNKDESQSSNEEDTVFNLFEDNEAPEEKKEEEYKPKAPKVEFYDI